MSKDGRDEQHHPAFGLIGFNRVSGGGQVFFGSSVESQNYITLRIYQAYLEHGLGRDSIFTEDIQPLVEVALTNHQFAELLTSMNVGHGVPCTIKRVNGQNVDPIEKLETENDRVRGDFKEKLQQKVEAFKEHQNRINEILAKDKLSKADRQSIANLLSSIHTEYTSNMPFALEQFEKSTRKMEAQAKAEVDAFITHAIVKTGLQQLRESGSLPQTLLDGKSEG